MRNVSDKSCIENQNTHFMFSNTFPKSGANVEKFGTGGQAADNIIRRMRFAHWIPEVTSTLRLCNIIAFPQQLLGEHVSMLRLYIICLYCV